MTNDDIEAKLKLHDAMLDKLRELIDVVAKHLSQHEQQAADILRTLETVRKSMQRFEKYFDKSEPERGN